MTNEVIEEIFNGYVQITDDSYLERTGRTETYKQIMKIERKLVHLELIHDIVKANGNDITSINCNRKVIKIVGD